MEEFLDFEKSLTQNYSKLRCMRKYLPADELDMRIRFLYSTMHKKLYGFFYAGTLSYQQFDYIDQIFRDMFSDKTFYQSELVVVQFRTPGCKYYL